MPNKFGLGLAAHPPPRYVNQIIKMKPLIVYQSRTGNTQIIANAISSVLNADTLSVDDATSKDFGDRNLVGFGSGIYWTMIDKKIYDLVSFLPEKCCVFPYPKIGLLKEIEAI